MEDAKAFRMENLCIHIRQGRAEQTGFYVDARGRTRRTMTYREHFETEAGEMDPDTWEEMMRGCVDASAHLQELFQRIIRHGESNWAWIREQKERETYALDILSSRAYRHWDDFMRDSMQDGLPEDSVFVFLFDRGG